MYAFDASVNDYFDSKSFTVLFHYLSLQTTKRLLDRQISMSSKFSLDNTGKKERDFTLSNSRITKSILQGLFRPILV